MENLKRTLEEGVLRDLEYTFLTRDGREFPAELSASVIRNSSGNPTGFVAVTKDITERKRMEEELRTSAIHLKEYAERMTWEMLEKKEKLNGIIESMPEFLIPTE